ncbi:MAG: oxygen-independent coproporphyrinogen III oxidase, partial [Balneolaceae bacterium]
MSISKELTGWLNAPVPRYTSYPTAVQFGPADEHMARAVYRGQITEGSPVSLYLHLPFCKSLCWYCGCATVITRKQDQSDRYIDYLEKEILLLKRDLHPGHRVVQIHFGGGTPNFLTAAQLERLMLLLEKHFNYADEVEFGVEFDPRGLGCDQIAVLAAHGLNRASIGVQDVNPVVQEAIHRIQPEQMNMSAIKMLREAGINSINIDLIYGLPHQILQSYNETIDAVLRMDPDRITTFGYAHVPWMKPAQKLLESDALPGPDLRIELLQTGIRRFTEAGYRYIGIDHFAKPADELSRAQDSGKLHRNFQGYSTHSGVSIIGLGMTSISQLPTAYLQNARELDDYYRMLDEGRLPIVKGYQLTTDDVIRRDVIMTLMCGLELQFDRIEEKYNIRFTEYFSDELEKMEPFRLKGLVVTGSDHIRISETGRLFVRNLVHPFDSYSRTISRNV